MAEVAIRIAGRHYELACRDGEEEHLRTIAGMVDAKAADAERAVGGLGEAKQLLLAALLLADELNDMKTAKAAEPAPVAEPAPAAIDPAFATALERLAERMEAIAGRA